MQKYLCSFAVFALFCILGSASGTSLYRSCVFVVDDLKLPFQQNFLRLFQRLGRAVEHQHVTGG